MHPCGSWGVVLRTQVQRECFRQVRGNVKTRDFFNVLHDRIRAAIASQRLRNKEVRWPVVR